MSSSKNSIRQIVSAYLRTFNQIDETQLARAG